MVDASVVVSIVIAVISLLSAVVVAVIGHVSTRNERKAREASEREARDESARLQKQLNEQQSTLAEEVKKRDEKRQSERETQALTAKYSPPLMIAAYELQARLYELCEYPISKEHLETVEGLEDIKIFTCYRFAQFLAWTYILETKTQYFSFTNDEKLKGIADRILRLNEEFDRRRNRDGQNIGVWPGSRLLISARMIRDDMTEKDVPLDMIVKNYHVFRREWDSQFKGPMSYFCHWIDCMVQSRMGMRRPDHQDDAMRCTQHNLVDMVKDLNPNGSMNQSLQCAPIEEGAWECDCDVCPWPYDQTRLAYRKTSRDNDEGLRPWYKKTVDSAYKKSINLEKFNKYTDTESFNTWLYGKEIVRDTPESIPSEPESD